MEITAVWMIFGLIFFCWVANPTIAQNRNASSRESCFPGNIYNNNLTLTGSSGTLQSPMKGSSYLPDSSCDWLITVPEGNIVKLNFDKFNLQSDYADCSADYVEILDGNSTFSKSEGKFCGHLNPGIFRSSDRYMWVRFRSDSWFSFSGSGFKATFTAEGKTICPYNYNQVLTASASHSKTLTSPKYPLNSDNNLQCKWILQVDNDLPFGDYIVKVIFDDLQLACDDKLVFYDGNNDTLSNLLGSYCGGVSPEVIYSTGQRLFVEFYTDSYLTYRGFSFKFLAVKKEEASSLCRSSNGTIDVHFLNGSSGTFFTPDYPVPYPDSCTCIWVISVPAVKRVRLTIQGFHLEDHDDKDYVQIRDGELSQSREIALFRGYHSFSSASGVYSTGSHMWVKFHSNSGTWESSITGFKARFDAVDPPGSSKELCFPGNINNEKLEITGSQGTLHSPVNPNPDSGYPSHLSCGWLIIVPDGKIIKLSFVTFEMRWTADCTADCVEVLDGKFNYSESKGRFCGHATVTPDDIVSTGRYMRVRFRSGRIRSPYKGFTATFTAEDTLPAPASSTELCFPGNVNNNNLKLAGTYGTFKIPQTSYSMYPINLNCDWLITVPGGKIVELSFDRFDLQPKTASTCTADYVEVLDGMYSDSESLGKYCGPSNPDDIRSSDRYMWVRFRSDDEYVYHGFKATFQAVDNTSYSSQKIPMYVTIGVAVFISLILYVVCIARRRRRRRRAEDRFPMAPVTNSASPPSQSRATRHLPSSEVPRRMRPGNPHRPPPVGYAPVPESPPPDYPYPLESPPPYPGKEQGPQFPPPGQSYPWQQSNESDTVEPSAPPEVELPVYPRESMF